MNWNSKFQLKKSLPVRRGPQLATRSTCLAVKVQNGIHIVNSCNGPFTSSSWLQLRASSPPTESRATLCDHQWACFSRLPWFLPATYAMLACEMGFTARRKVEFTQLRWPVPLSGESTIFPMWDTPCSSWRSEQYMELHSTVICVSYNGNCLRLWRGVGATMHKHNQ